MASKNLIDIALRLSKELGANTNKFLGSRTNISFLGKGPKDDLLFQSDLNVEALPAFPLEKIIPQIESSMGYLTGGKLNDIQATKLISNLEKIKEFNFPVPSPANITDLASGTGNLTPGGLEYLRKTGRAGKKVGEEGLDVLRATRKTDDDFRVIKEEFAPAETVSPLMSRIEGQMEKIKGTSSKLDDAMKEYENIYKSADDLPPPGSRGGADDIAAPVQQFSNEIDALETMTKNRAGSEFITGYVDEVYKNSGALSSVDIPKKRAAAREFLFTMLKKETDLLPQGGTLESVISPTDYKYITEGGGGALGDPLILVKKYFGDTVAKRLPLNSDRVVIEEFVDNVRFTKDKAGFATDDPRFNPDDLPEFKHGGLAKILEV
jgi:hypothetical protein